MDSKIEDALDELDSRAYLETHEDEIYLGGCVDEARAEHAALLAMMAAAERRLAAADKLYEAVRAVDSAGASFTDDGHEIGCNGCRSFGSDSDYIVHFAGCPVSQLEKASLAYEQAMKGGE